MDRKIKSEMIIVNSSAIFSLEYDWRLNSLLVSFQKKGLYSYRNVPDEIYYELKFADSIGKAFREKVLNKYEFTRLS
jgi:hypothetical protein